MNISVESYGHAAMLNLKGEMTADGLAALQQAVDHQLNDPDVIDIVLNMENVPFVDSAALEHLLNLQDRLAERLGQVKLVAIDENIAKIHQITRLESTFEVHKDVSQAVKAAQA